MKILIFAALSSSVTSTNAQFLLPPNSPNTNTESAIWDVFSHAKFTPNSPDLKVDTPTRDASLICTTSSAFLTSSGNIYSFQSSISCQISDSASFVIRDLSLQIRSLGSQIDPNSIRLIIPNSGGTPISIPPTRSFLVSQETLSPDGQNQGGVGDLRFYQWDLRDTPIPPNQRYDLLFRSQSSSLSLDQVKLFTSDTYTAVNGTQALTLQVATSPAGLLQLRYPAFYQHVALLETSSRLGPNAQWFEVQAPTNTDGDDCVINISPSQTQGFFRLRIP